jgi:hypothetical protein
LSPGLRTGLIVGGLGLGAIVVWKVASAHGATLGGGGTVPTTGPAIIPPGVVPGSSGGGTGTSKTKTVGVDLLKFGMLPVTATLAAVNYVPGVKQVTGAVKSLASDIGGLF